MTAPWIEIKENQDPEIPAGPGCSEYIWQAVFACQVEVPPHQDWVKLKWGFNASALFDEALERQRLFLESHYGIRSEYGVESPDYRTMAFRFINRPGEGLQLAIIGKIHGCTQEEAAESARSYYSALSSTLPYDYSLVPALNQNEFQQMSGSDILNETNDQLSMAQIKRLEVPILPERNRSPFAHGFWRSTPHAHEPIWRTLSASASPLLLNISMRSTALYEKEREILRRSAEEDPDDYDFDPPTNQNTASTMKQWYNDYTERRLGIWKKLFYLQIHLVSSRKINENLFRTLGTSFTMGNDGKPHPGIWVISPRLEESRSWLQSMKNLDFVFSGSSLTVHRLSEMADLEEVLAVMRLPYSPPEKGFPDVKFSTIRNR